MIDMVSVERCVLCKACSDACPTKAIQFTKEYCGFQYPQINSGKCIGCNRCETVCPTLNLPPKTPPMITFEAKNKNEKIRFESSSGGLFSALAASVINDGGIVVGAKYDKDWSVCHALVENMADLSLLRGSKYAQSNTSNIYSKITHELKQGRTILFSGCPCQCAALRTYLKNERYIGKLYVVDFVCHGILSENLFHEYIEFLEKKAGSKIKKFQFRDKTYGWADSGPKVVYENNRTMCWPLYEDIYMQGYFQSICMKESCHTCPYKDFHSGSDLTMGDFWGAEIIEPEFYEKSGISLVLVQTPAGEELFNKSKPEMVYKPLSLEKLATYNQGIFYPFEAGKMRKEYFELAAKRGYFSALESMVRISHTERVKRIYRKLRRQFKKK